jgi:hypothetical protein
MDHFLSKLKAFGSRNKIFSRGKVMLVFVLFMH